MIKLTITIVFAVSLFCVPGVISAQKTNAELVEINFNGNSYISDGELESAIFSLESPGWVMQFLDYFGIGESAVYFDSLLIPEDITSLEAFYLDQGFFEAEIKADYEISEDSSEAILNFEIVEGDPSLYESFDIQGLYGLDENVQNNVFTEIIEVDTTDRFTREVTLRNINAVNNYLKDHGYALVKNDVPDVIIDTVRNKTRVKVLIDPGERYKIQEIKVQKSGPGEALIRDTLIKEIVGIEKGDYYSAYDITRAQVRLYRTNLFSSAVVNGAIADTSGDRMPLNVSTSVGLLNEVSPEIIVNNENNAFNLGLGVTYSRKNFLGDARLFSIGLSTASENITNFITDFSINDTTLYGYADGRISIEQPYLFGKPINTTVESYVTLQKQRNEYNALIYGAKLSLNFELPRRAYFTGLNISLDWIKSRYEYSDNYLNEGIQVLLRKIGIPDSLLESTALDFVENEIGDKGTENTNTILGMNLIANKTDDVLFPTKGYSLSLLVEDGNSIAYLLSKTGLLEFNNPLFFKGTVSGSIYFPVFDDDHSTLGGKLKIGNIFTYYGNKGDIPINQRLYAGGSNSVRGWATRTLVPDLEFSTFSLDDITDILRGLSPGGFFLMEGSIESRNTLIGNFGSAVFFDFGNVWNSYTDFQFSTVALAAGFGLRYYSEFAPLRIDFGFKVYDPDNRRSFFKKRILPEAFEFHLGIGEAF